MSLESRHYVATLEDVATLTREIIDAQNARTDGRATYLRALIATTQAELGETPRQRAAGSVKLSPQERIEQMAALETVGERFYRAVVKAAKDKLGLGERGNQELHSRTAFARSSLSTLRRWVRHGGDITGLVAGRTTKAALAVPGRRKGGPSAKVLGNQARRYTVRLEQTLSTLAVADREAAFQQWQRLKTHMERVFQRAGNGGARAGRTTRATHQHASA